MSSRKSELSNNLCCVEERIANSLKVVRRERSSLTLIVVTKTFPVEDCLLLYDLGIRDFGENRDQEGRLKSKLLPADVSWHFQGQIQSNKINSIAKWADVVHSLDSVDHAAKFSESERNLSFFVQVNLEPGRTDRGGIPEAELESFLRIARNLGLSVIGLMTVPPLNSQKVRALPCFEQLLRMRDRLQKLGFSELVDLSMGMSGDFEQGILAGATHIRIGSSILGTRPTLT